MGKHEVYIDKQEPTISKPFSKSASVDVKWTGRVISLVSGLIGALIGALSAYFVAIKKLRATIHINIFNNILSDKGSQADFIGFIRNLNEGFEDIRKRDVIKNNVKSSYNQAWFLVLFSNCKKMEKKFKDKVEDDKFNEALNIIKLVLSGKGK